MEEQADWRQTEPMEEQEQTERRRGRIFRARMFYVQVGGARAIFNSFPSMQRHKANVKFRPNLGVLSPLPPPPPPPGSSAYDWDIPEPFQWVSSQFLLVPTCRQWNEWRNEENNKEIHDSKIVLAPPSSNFANVSWIFPLTPIDQPLPALLPSPPLCSLCLAPAA